MHYSQSDDLAQGEVEGLKSQRGQPELLRSLRVEKARSGWGQTGAGSSGSLRTLTKNNHIPFLPGRKFLNYIAPLFII